MERSKQRLLVVIGKVVAQSQSVSHMGTVTWAKKMDQKLASVLVPETFEKDELGNNNAVH